jgi:hypothetical protein
MSLTKEDIITTDKYLENNPNYYYKTDVIHNNNSMKWRGVLVHQPNKNLKLLVSGHSDYPITDKLVDFYRPNIWFTVNKQTTRNNVFSLPLGITNNTNESELHRIYGNLDCMIDVMKENIEIKNLVYMNMNISTYPLERQIVWDLFKDKKWVTIGRIKNTIEGRTKFLRDIKSHTFVLCPRGNGIDTHRLWETLYMGSIPIVKKNIGYSEFEDLPICFVNDWTDISQEWLENEKNRILNKEWNMDKLKISYWLNKINSVLL